MVSQRSLEEISVQVARVVGTKEVEMQSTTKTAIVMIPGGFRPIEGILEKGQNQDNRGLTL